MSAGDRSTRRSAAGADFLQLDPGEAPGRGLTTWLAGALRAGICAGRLRTGTFLPATRVLADDLGISRGVVVEAYQRLAEEGLVSARPRSGTRVLPRGQESQRQAPGLVRPAPGNVPPGLAITPPAPGLAPPAPGLAPPAAATAPPAAAPRTPAGEQAPPRLPGRWRAHAEIDLSPGVPDLSAFPRAAWLRAERAALNEASPADLGYGDPRGSRRLRGELAGWLARTRGIVAAPQDIIIVTGVAQALALLAQVLRAQAVTGIAVEDPGSRGAREQVARWGLEPVPVPVDDQGLQVAELESSGLRAALLTPAHQFPTGVVLAPQRRRDLLGWAAAGGLVVEDDYDAEYRYDRAPVPALQASAPARIAYAASTSKTLAPGLRLGWLIPPSSLHADVIAAKHASDLGCPALPQLALAHLIASGELERHVRTVRGRQRRRRDALLAALREHLPGARVQGIPAGLHLLITFPDLAGQLDDTDLAGRMRLAGVLAHPLSWHRTRPGPPGLVLGYAAHTPDQLREAAGHIGRAVNSSARPGPPGWGTAGQVPRPPGIANLA